MAKKIIPEQNLVLELTNELRGFKAPQLARYVLEHSLMAELVKLCLSKEALLSSRAMWVLSWCSQLNDESIMPYHDALIENLEAKNLHKGVIRNTLRLYQYRPAPEKYRAFLLDTCYTYIKNPSEAIAVRAFAITVVYNISKPYPELLHEL